MKLAMFSPQKVPHSVRAYTENVVRHLTAMGIEVVALGEKGPLRQDVDLYWDPRAAGGVAPYGGLRSTSKPLVVTLHGSAPLALPAREIFPNLRIALVGKLYNLKKKRDWRAFRGRCAAIITVSAYAKEEVVSHLHLDEEKIVPIYHGVNHDLFRPTTTQASPQPYLLHVSAYRPKKNFDRILAAYARLPQDERPSLVAVVPGYPSNRAQRGVRLIRTPMSHEQIAPLYQEAMGFVFPSLHETFGMPIVEAMACGCPVITSNITSCPEVAGDAALLVNPRSVEEISHAMRRLSTDSELREDLRRKALRRAGLFTWRRSAEAHLSVFEQAMRDGGDLPRANPP